MDTETDGGRMITILLLFAAACVVVALFEYFDPEPFDDE